MVNLFVTEHDLYEHQFLIKFKANLLTIVYFVYSALISHDFRPLLVQVDQLDCSLPLCLFEVCLFLLSLDHNYV